MTVARMPGPWIFAVLFALGVQAVCAQDAGEARPGDRLRADMRTILDAGEGQVRKWTAPPVVVVVHRDGRVPDLVREAIASVEEGRANFFGFGELRLLDLDDIGDDLFGMIDLSAENGDLAFRWRSAGGPRRVTGDIFVFALDLREMLLTGALTRADARYMRPMARGRDLSYFYSAWSRNDALAFATVHVATYESDPHFAGCLYEELIQALGLLNDAEGTEVFTLSNAERKPGSRPASSRRALR